MFDFQVKSGIYIIAESGIYLANKDDFIQKGFEGTGFGGYLFMGGASISQLVLWAVFKPVDKFYAILLQGTRCQNGHL